MKMYFRSAAIGAALVGASVLRGRQHLQVQRQHPADFQKAGGHHQMQPLHAGSIATQLANQSLGERRLLQVHGQPHQLAVHVVVARRIFLGKLRAQLREGLERIRSELHPEEISS